MRWENLGTVFAGLFDWGSRLLKSNGDAHKAYGYLKGKAKRLEYA